MENGNSRQLVCFIYKLNFEKEIFISENETETALEKIESIEPIENICRLLCTVDDSKTFATERGEYPVLLNLEFKPET